MPTYEALVAQLDLRLEEGDPAPDGPLVVDHALTLERATLGPTLTCTVTRWSPDWQLACDLAVSGDPPPEVWWGGVAARVTAGTLRFAPMPRTATGRLSAKAPGALGPGLLSRLAGPQALPADLWGTTSDLAVDDALLVAEPPFEPTPPPAAPAAPSGAADLGALRSGPRAVLLHEPGPVTPGALADEVRSRVEQQSTPFLACYGVVGRADAAGAYLGRVDVAQDGAVSAVTVAGPDGQVAACLERKVRSWRLPAGASVQWTWVFSPE